MSIWEKKLQDFIFQRDQDGKFVVDLRYLSGIPRLLLGGPKNLLAGKRGEYWNKMKNNIGRNEDGARTSFIDFANSIATNILEKGYSSLFLPTFIPQQNLLFSGEEKPSEELVWKYLYLIYTSIRFRNSLVNFDDISDDGRICLQNILVTTKVIVGEKTDTGPIKRVMGIKLFSSGKFFDTFSLLSFLRKKAEEEKEKYEDPWLACCKKYGFSDTTSVIVMGREVKGEYHIFSNLSPLFQKWLEPAIVQFLDSFTHPAIVNTQKRQVLDHVSDEREKLVFYLLKHKVIHGELLAKLTELNTTHQLKSEKILGMFYAKSFFSKL